MLIFWQEQDIFILSEESRATLGAHQSSLPVSTESFFPQGSDERRVMSAVNHHLMLRTRRRGAVTPLPLVPSRLGTVSFTFWVGFLYYKFFRNLDCLKILGTVSVTWCEFRLVASQIIGAVHNIQLSGTWLPGILHPWCITSLNTCLERYEVLCCLGRMCAFLQCRLFCLLVKRYLHINRICTHKVDRMLCSVPCSLQWLRGYTSHVYLAFIS